MNYNNVKDGKTIAIISYLWIIGLLIAFLMNQEKRNYFAAFHIRQSFGLSLLIFAISLVTKFGIPIFGSIIFLGWFVLWVIGILGAIKGEEKPVPLFGDSFQNWFKNLG